MGMEEEPKRKGTAANFVEGVRQVPQSPTCKGSKGQKLCRCESPDTAIDSEVRINGGYNDHKPRVST